jgi:hypothetical protein
MSMKSLKRVGPIAMTQPNWSNPVSVEYQFKTSVLTAEDGSEQREALRQTARVSLSFDAILHADEMRRQVADLAAGQHKRFVVPARWRTVHLAAPATGGATTLSVDSVPFWLVQGTTVVLFDGDTMESVEVSSIAGTTLTLSTPLVTDFAPGSRVHPAIWGRVQDTVSFAARTNRTWTGSARFDADPAADPQPIAPATPTLFEGRELFLTRPNWKSSPSITFKQTQDVVDFDTGLIEVGTPRVDHTITLKMGYLGKSADEAEQLIGLFLRMRGRRNSFWMPTWQDDISPKIDAPVGSSTIEVAGSEFRDAFATSKTYTVLAVEWKDGFIQVNRIASQALSGSLDSVLTTTDPWVRAVDSSATVMWCPQWRFATDLLEVQWVTDQVAEVTFALQSLMNEAP